MDRVLTSTSNTAVLNISSNGYISLDVSLANYAGVTNSSSVTCGNVIINSTFIDVGWDGLGNGVLVGNNIIQTGQVEISSTNVTIGTLTGNSGVVLNANNLLIGGVTINSSIVAVGNTRIFSNTIFVGNGSSNASITYNSIYVGNSTINTSINTSILASGFILTYSSNVGNLPPSPLDGTRGFVNDSSLPLANNAGANVSGGGTNHVPVYYDGGVSRWRLGG